MPRRPRQLSLLRTVRQRAARRVLLVKPRGAKRKRGASATRWKARSDIRSAIRGGAIF